MLPVSWLGEHRGPVVLIRKVEGWMTAGWGEENVVERDSSHRRRVRDHLPRTSAIVCLHLTLCLLCTNHCSRHSMQ